jgi:hypothetical protein
VCHCTWVSYSSYVLASHDVHLLARQNDWPGSMVTSNEGMAGTVQALLDAGANINLQDKVGGGLRLS